MKKFEALLPNGNKGMSKCTVKQYERHDENGAVNIYLGYMYLRGILKDEHADRLNSMPEELTERLFCLVTGSVKVIKTPPNFSEAFDMYDLKRFKRQELKSTTLFGHDNTSFSPHTRCDELFFMDFNRYGTIDGTFHIYSLDMSDVLALKMNSKETFLDQQLQFRRPRFSVKEALIKPKGLKPFYTGKVGNIFKKIRIRKV
jgi:hypothetical protein